MAHVFETLLLEDNGQGLVEYALIMALIALATIGTVSVLGITVRTLFEGPLPAFE